MSKLPVLLALTLVFAACKREETAAPAAPAASAPAPQAAAATDDESADAPADGALDVAVNEPLPPFEEDSGIELISQSQLAASDAALAISGEVTLYQAPDGSRLLRLENLQTPKELRIDVALSKSAQPAGADDARAARVLGALKGPSGSMNYLLESGTDISGVQSVMLLEHEQARVLAVAPLQKPAAPAK